MNYDEHLKTGVYTVYDQQVLKETLIVSEKTKDGVKYIHQIAFTGSATPDTCQYRFYNASTDSWSNWRQWTPPTT